MRRGRRDMATATNIHPPDVTTWNIDSVEACVEGIKAAIMAAVQEVITEAQKGGVRVTFGVVEWPDPDEPSDGKGKVQPGDPSTLLIDLPIGPSDLDDAVWNFSLDDAVNDLIDLYEGGADRKISGHDAVKCAAVRDALRQLADRIDERLDMPPTATSCPSA